MSTPAELQHQWQAATMATRAGPPARPSNPFFGVGPIIDASQGEVESRLNRLAFDRWLSATYRKRDDRGQDLGGYTTSEIARSMHRGEPADAILLDMMRAIHGYFGLPASNRLAIGLGGGHSGFTVCMQHLMTMNDPGQQVFIDTPIPEGKSNQNPGFFRQSWAAQIWDLCRLSQNGTADRLHFATGEGAIPTAQTLAEMGIRLFVGVGHETTGATTYTVDEVRSLLDWLDGDPANRHAVIDATSLLGAMPWPEYLIAGLVAKCCLFMPLQKAIGGVPGYFTASFTPQALEQIDRNLANPSWAIARQLSLAPPLDPAKPISGGRSVATGPFYDAAQDRMLGGVINTFSLPAFVETTFALRETERRAGPVAALNARSTSNRDAVTAWVTAHPLFELVVSDPERRGSAVTLLRVNDPGSAPFHARILARAKQLLGHEGLSHPDGRHEPGLNAARYVNGFPGMPGDFRAWIGGVREASDIPALLDNLAYAWQRAKALIMEEELAAIGATVPLTQQTNEPPAVLPFELGGLAANSETLAAILSGLAAIHDPQMRRIAVERHVNLLQTTAMEQIRLLAASGFAIFLTD